MCVFYAGHFKHQVVRLVVAHGNKKSRWEKKDSEYSDAFENEPLNSCRSLGYARSNKSISVFNYLCKPMELYIYVRKKHPFTSYPAAKHLNTTNLRLQTTEVICVTDIREKPVDFYDTARASTFAPAIILRIRALLQKFLFNL